MENPTRTDRSERRHDAPSGTDEDSLYEVLADPRRRSVLACLYEHDTPVELSDLADAVATRNAGAGGDGATPEDAEHVYVTLYHVHIPMMDEAGVVEYDREAKTVRLPTNDHRLDDVRDLADA